MPLSITSPLLDFISTNVASLGGSIVEVISLLIVSAWGPEILTIPMPPRPGAVAIAQIVSESKCVIADSDAPPSLLLKGQVQEAVVCLGSFDCAGCSQVAYLAA